MATPLPLDRSSYSSREVHADAFAFADLMPRRMLLEAEASGFRGPHLEHWVRAEISRYAPGWPEGRVDDRAETQLGVR